MRVRLALTLLFALTAIAAASDVVAQGPVPVDPASGAAAVVGHPRTAVLTLHDGAAEAFLLPDDSSAESPLLIHGRGDRVHLLAEYEAVFAPLTAGWARFALAAYLVDDQDEKLLDDDTAESVALGPSLRGGRLGVRLELEPGLHTIRLVSTAAVRPVGVTDWIVDRDTATVWVFVPAAGGAPPVSAVLESPATGGALSDGMQPAVAAAAVGSDERRLTQAGAALPVGGLPVGDQRAAAGPSAAAAVNFDAGAGSVLRVVTGQPIRVWSDCELWLSEGAAGDAQCELSVSYRSGADSADLAPLASDAL
ncbi:MAG: hypothetical protein ACK2UL_02475, partial [Anaerolineae bacterium]